MRSKSGETTSNVSSILVAHGYGYQEKNAPIATTQIMAKIATYAEAMTAVSPAVNVTSPMALVRSRVISQRIS